MERMFQRTGIKISRLRCTLFRHTYAFTSQIEILPFEFRKDREELLEKTNKLSSNVIFVLPHVVAIRCEYSISVKA